MFVSSRLARCFGPLGKFQHNIKISIKTARVSRLCVSYDYGVKQESECLIKSLVGSEMVLNPQESLPRSNEGLKSKLDSLNVAAQPTGEYGV